LREVYGNLGFKAGFSKADEVLATASRGIAEVITHHYTQNIDLRDAKTVLSNSGTAIMGSATAEGETRAKDAIISALDSPLLNDNKITGAKNVLLLIVSGTNEITLDEIGEINDHIQSEAGFNANIIMGVGEDETLGDAIAVTVIATGFDLEQQNEIVNSEPKKIIHALEDEQKITHNLSNTPVPAFDLNTETPVASEERIVFELLEEEPAAAIVAEAVPAYDPITNENDLIVMSEFIKNLDVTFEIVSPINDIDFTFTTPEVHAIETAQPKAIQVEEQAALSFDLPLFKSEPVAEENKIVFELTNEINDMHVVDPVVFVPVTEVAENGVIRHSLEEYMEVENDFVATKTIEKVAEVVPEELNITMKKIDESTIAASEFESISPMEMTIEETLRARADERRRKLKEFNYKFHNNVSKIDEYEKEPAYKRLGVELSANQSNTNNSRISVGTDSNNDLQLRSNNSYLHDNVD
jgi:cell division protein FtsZ